MTLSARITAAIEKAAVATSGTWKIVRQSGGYADIESKLMFDVVAVIADGLRSYDADFLVDAHLNIALLKECHERLVEAERDAARWNALLNCDRIRILGWAGLDMQGHPKPDADGYVHFGAEFWTHHSAGTDNDSRQVLTSFADAAIAKEKQP